jgi:hypothetical protein
LFDGGFAFLFELEFEFLFEFEFPSEFDPEFEVEFVEFDRPLPPEFAGMFAFASLLHASAQIPPEHGMFGSSHQKKPSGSASAVRLAGEGRDTPGATKTKVSTQFGS